ncbi:MAG: trehalose-phosphatase [Caulobacteraceae bacterium]
MASTAKARPRSDIPPAPPLLDLTGIALFADLDGTLARIEATPDAVKPDPERRRLMDSLLRALSGRLAVVSGRGLADIDRVLEGRVPAVAAVHGLVRRDAAGRVAAAREADKIGEALDDLRAFAVADRGLLVENKDSAVALHYRRAPQTEEACRELARRLGATLGLSVQEGDMVVELRTPGEDKGGSVRAFMREAPFAGFKPVFLGDDLTDENGFAAAEALGGFGVVVGPRRPTAARYALADVGAVRDWLAHSLARAN